MLSLKLKVSNYVRFINMGWRFAPLEIVDIKTKQLVWILL